MQIHSNSVCLVLLAAAIASVAQNAETPASAGDKSRPDRGSARLADYTGPEACGTCHRAIFELQKTSEMARSGWRPAENRILLDHPAMSYERGKFSYSIKREDGKAILTVSDGQDRISEPLFIAIGANSQIYYFKHHGEFYRAPVSYSPAQSNLVLDGEFESEVPGSLEAALGHPLSDTDMRSCLHCHSNATAVGDGFDITNLAPGDTCEACHGPGAKHVTAMRQGKLHDGSIFNPAHLQPREELDFCGECHHSIQEVKQGVFRGTKNVIPQAYRLAASRCWNAADPRSRCTFCHDPHAPMAKGTAAYDDKCLACHVTSATAPVRADQPGKWCPVGQRDCAHCHMPRQALTNPTQSFTDHRIRVVVVGAPYPE
jgi:hypothetical protein